MKPRLILAFVPLLLALMLACITVQTVGTAAAHGSRATAACGPHVSKAWANTGARYMIHLLISVPRSCRSLVVVLGWPR